MTDNTPKLPKDERVAVYICHCGGNISDAVKVEELEELARRIPGVSVVRRNTFMCSDPGQQLIIDDLKAGNADRVVVCACAPHLHETTFRGAVARGGLNPYMYEHANIREQVSWVHHGPGATAKAAKLVQAAVAKAGNLRALEPIRMEARRHATVVGGGIAGMKAALDLARRGIDVTLVEKSPFLGGNLARLDRLFPTEDKAADLLASLYAQVTASRRITVLTCAEVVAHSGYVGHFDLTVRRAAPTTTEDLELIARFEKAGSPLGTFVPFVGFAPVLPATAEETIAVATGAVVLAVGFRHYVPRQGEYGYGDNPEVVTLTQLIEALAGEQPGGQLMVNGRAIRTMALIRCVGSRHIPGVDEEDENGNLNQHCSRVCCTASLQAEREIKQRFPETVIYDFYRDIRAYGRGHEEYYCGASRDGVLFIRFEPTGRPVVARSPAGSDNPLTVTVADKLLADRELEVPVDLVVLANGMVPGDTAKLVELTKIPTGADRFLLEVHPKLRPVEVKEAGILLAGTCQAPMDTTEACAAAAAAAVKAAAVLSRGYVELDPFVARIDPELCKGTGACIEECPQEGCMSLVDGKATVNPALCTGCGMCVAVCPEGAIEVNGWTLRQYEAMVDAIVAAPVEA